MPWDWFIIDMSYIMVLLGGSLVFRAKDVSLTTWMLFGMLSTFVGTILMVYTWQAQVAFAAASAQQDVVAVLSLRC